MTASTAPARRPTAARIFLISGLGTALEFYDFSIYGLAAALVFPTVFFPEVSPMVGSLIAFATFGTGFIARPLGGVFFGHFGDRIGRRPVLITTLITMGVSTMLIGFLPGHEALGDTVVVILVLLRLIQGFAAGGEWGGSSIVGIEAAPVGRRGLWGSFTSVGIGVGTLAGTLAFTFASLPGHDFLVTIGWRIPFIAGCVLILVGLIARLTLPKEDEDPQHDAPVENKLPLWVAISSHPKAVICAIGISFGYTALAYLVGVFFITYTIGIGFSETDSLNAQNISTVALFLCALLFGGLSDRFGRRAVLIFGALGGIVVIIAFFPALATNSVPLMFLMFVLNAIFAGATQGPIPAFLGEQFPRRARYSGISLTYQIGAALGGGTASVIGAALLLAFDGGYLGLEIYSVAVSVVMAVCALGLKETSQLTIEEINHPTTAPPASAEPAAR
ncbi:MAG: MFS transporter [Microbacterium sp.]